MWQCRIFVPILLLVFSFKAWGIDESIRQRYPNVLLTNDYGILNENDLVSRPWEGKPIPFSISAKKGHPYIYWQCFPRENISITLKDKGYSGSEIGGDDNFGDLTIEVILDHGISHEYQMRRPWSVSGYAERFKYWQRFMKNEKYVCLAGSSGFLEETKGKNVKRQRYSWIYEKLKTKKGCDSFFAGQCNWRRRMQGVRS
jgi:hypothetical protein